jgi:hypothetical protein
MVLPRAGDMGPAWGPFFFHRNTTSQTLFSLDRKFRPHFSHFTDFGRHGLIEEGEGNRESMVSPSAGDMGPAWGPFLSHGDTTSQTLFTSDRKFRLHFSHFTDFVTTSCLKGREMESRRCPHVQGTWGLLGDPFFLAGTPPVKHFPLFFTLDRNF